MHDNALMNSIKQIFYEEPGWEKTTTTASRTWETLFGVVHSQTKSLRYFQDS